jgi:hypothetical protein
MNRSALALLDDASLRRALTAAVVAERTSVADVLAHLAEFDARKLFVAAGCSTLFAYCVEELRYSESVSFHHHGTPVFQNHSPRSLIA